MKSAWITPQGTVFMIALWALLTASTLMAGHSPNISIWEKRANDGSIHFYGSNKGVIPYTVTVNFPVFLNYKSSTEVPCQVVIPAGEKHLPIVVLSKDKDGMCSQYRYTVVTSPGDQLKQRIVQKKSWLFSKEVVAESENKLERFSVEEPDAPLNRYAAKPLVREDGTVVSLESGDTYNRGAEIEERLSVNGSEVTNGLFRGYRKRLERSDILTIRVKNLGSTRIFFAQNGCVRPQAVKISFDQLLNMEASRKVPYTAIIPPLTEHYLLFIRCPDTKPYKYRYSFLYRPCGRSILAP